MSDLDIMLRKDWKKGHISGLHWFRDASKWYGMNYAFNNPYNVGSIHPELFLIREHGDDLAKYMKNRQLIFIGVGTGDTEMALANICLDRWDYAEIIAVDVNARFLADFAHSIRAKMKEDDKDRVLYLGLHTIFERLTAAKFRRGGANFKRRLFVCLGNTVGNYTNLSDIFAIFARIASPGDLLLLGYQTDAYLETIFSKYENNRLLRSMLHVCMPSEKRSMLKWKLDKNRSTITAWCENVEIFRSRKMKLSTILGVASQFRFSKRAAWVDSVGNVGLLLMIAEG